MFLDMWEQVVCGPGQTRAGAACWGWPFWPAKRMKIVHFPGPGSKPGQTRLAPRVHYGQLDGNVSVFSGVSILVSGYMQSRLSCGQQVVPVDFVHAIDDRREGAAHYFQSGRGD